MEGLAGKITSSLHESNFACYNCINGITSAADEYNFTSYNCTSNITICGRTVEEDYPAHKSKLGFALLVASSVRSLGFPQKISELLREPVRSGIVVMSGSMTLSSSEYSQYDAQYNRVRLYCKANIWNKQENTHSFSVLLYWVLILVLVLVLGS